MRSHHYFDWEGFLFGAKLLVVVVIAVFGGRFALEYAATSHDASPSLVLIQETRPATPRALALSLATTTSKHIIRTLTFNDVVPPTGKFIGIDLSTMVLTLYQDGAAIAKYPILAKGEAGSLYETPAGFYTALSKEPDYFDANAQIDLPWEIRFSGNYTIHGWPLAADGSPADTAHAGGDIRLSTDDAKSVYDFALVGTGIFVYDPARPAPASLVLDAPPAPSISAAAYLVADIDTGDVFLERGAGNVLPITSVTRLMTALTVNETLPADTQVALPHGTLASVRKDAAKTKEMFLAGDLLYPLLLGSNTTVANSLTQTYGTQSFIGWMNASAKALDMSSTHFSDALGTTTANTSTTDDLFHLAAYLANNKSFILEALRMPEKDLIAGSGNVYRANRATTPEPAMLSVSSLFINGIERRVAIVVLRSNDAAADTAALTAWVNQSAERGADLAGTTCVACALSAPYRKIQE